MSKWTQVRSRAHELFPNASTDVEGVCRLLQELAHRREGDERLAEVERRKNDPSECTKCGTRMPSNMDAEMVQDWASYHSSGKCKPADAPTDVPVESYCHRCKGRNISWSAPSPLWNEVMRDGDINGEWKFNEIICPMCFAEIAEEKGIADYWHFDSPNVQVPLKFTTPSGRIWNGTTWLWEEVMETGKIEFENENEKFIEAVEHSTEGRRALAFKGLKEHAMAVGLVEVTDDDADAYDAILRLILGQNETSAKPHMTTLPNGLTDTREVIEKVVGKVSERII